MSCFSSWGQGSLQTLCFVLTMTFLRFLCRNCWSIYSCYTVPAWLRFFLLFLDCYLFFYCQISETNFLSMFFCPKMQVRILSVVRVLCCFCCTDAFGWKSLPFCTKITGPNFVGCTCFVLFLLYYYYYFWLWCMNIMKVSTLISHTF